MKKKIVTLMAIAIPWMMQAQITINVVVPPSGMMNKDQLWNLVLTNNTNSIRDVNLLMNLQDAATGQSVLSAGTTNITLSKGVKVITPRDVQPVQYNYGMSGFAGKFLPLGSYVACFTVSQFGAGKMQTLATECVRIHITPLSPPLLNHPSNKAVLTHSTPQLTWVPPAPLDMFDDLNYDVSVAEVMNGQSPAEAILYNTPLFVSSRLKAPYQVYPSTYSKLEPGKTYAWQVTARNGQQYAAVTEVWTFTMGADTSKATPVADGYVELKSYRHEGALHQVSGNKLLVKYYSFDKAHQSVVRFVNNDGKLVQKIKQAVSYGDNYLSFSLDRHFQPGQLYFIEITNAANEVQRAAFTIK